MNRVILIDGVEGSGKTFLVNKLKEEKKDWSFIKCPPEEVIKKHFDRMMSNDVHKCMIYVDALIKSIREAFISKTDTTLVFDRGWLSTLVYQGRRNKLIRLINERYNRLFQQLNVDCMESCIVLMCEEVKGKTREDKSDCPEKLELAKLVDKHTSFRKFAYAENQILPVYEFSWNKKKPTWIEINDIMSEVLEVI